MKNKLDLDGKEEQNMVDSRHDDDDQTHTHTNVRQKRRQPKERRKTEQRKKERRRKMGPVQISKTPRELEHLFF